MLAKSLRRNKMNNLMKLSLAVSIVLLGSSIASAQIVVDADAFPPATILNNAYPGVTLTALGAVPTSDVTSAASALASTGANVFSHTGGNQPGWGNGIFEYLRVDFASGAWQVSLDFIADDGSDQNAVLNAWNAGGVLVDTDVSIGTYTTGQVVTLTVADPDIAYITAEGDPPSGSDDWFLDNLVYWSTIDVDVDIKPGSCPNPFNPKSRGSVPVAILGAAAFDVNEIDLDSLLLAGVPIEPNNVLIADVSAPLGDPNDCYNCFDEDSDVVDGYLDLVVKFDTQLLKDAIGPAAKEACIKLELVGLTLSGAPIEGSDSMRILKEIGP
jgi:hypothetical protein